MKTLYFLKKSSLDFQKKCPTLSKLYSVRYLLYNLMKKDELAAIAIASYVAVRNWLKFLNLTIRVLIIAAVQLLLAHIYRRLET